jgi:DNA-binding transcriptional ArsR family regulator
VEPLAALGDATRRRIVEVLLAQPSSVSDIARQLPVSRPAVSQHLQILKSAGLVAVRTEGRRNIYRLDPQGLAALRDHLDSLWLAALEQFKTTAASSPPPRKERRK